MSGADIVTVALAAGMYWAASAIFIHKGINKSGGAGALLIFAGFPFFLLGAGCLAYLVRYWP